MPGTKRRSAEPLNLNPLSRNPGAIQLQGEELGMDENQLRWFLTISELGSVTRAAAKLQIAQPTLSQILLRLEEELGIKLFERTSRGVIPTEAGRVFQEHARNIVRDFERAREEVHRPDALSHTVVSVGLPSSISMLLGARLVIA